MFRYDGRFVANPRVLGSWTIVDQAATVDEFNRIGGGDYLFIEAGGFSTGNPVGWQSPWSVMKRH